MAVGQVSPRPHQKAMVDDEFFQADSGVEVVLDFVDFERPSEEGLGGGGELLFGDGADGCEVGVVGVGEGIPEQSVARVGQVRVAQAGAPTELRGLGGGF